MLDRDTAAYAYRGATGLSSSRLPEAYGEQGRFARGLGRNDGGEGSGECLHIGAPQA